MSVTLSSFRARLAATERELAVEALTTVGGRVKTAARLIGLHHTQLWRIIMRHNLQPLLRRHAPRGGNAAWQALGDE